MADVVDFYAHEGTDPYGRTLWDMIALTDYQLEASHDVIQWMFPLHEESNFNEDAPLVTPENVKVLRTKLCQDRIQDALLRYAAFLGFKYVDGQFRPTENFVHRAKVWRRHSNHNYLRITRVIRSLRLFGLDVLAKQFADACADIYPPMVLKGYILDRRKKEGPQEIELVALPIARQDNSIYSVPAPKMQ